MRRPCNVCMTFLPHEVDAFVQSNPTMEEALANLPQHQADYVAKVGRLARHQFMNVIGTCRHLQFAMLPPACPRTDKHRRSSLWLAENLRWSAQHASSMAEERRLALVSTTAGMHCGHDNSNNDAPQSCVQETLPIGSCMYHLWTPWSGFDR